MKSKDTPEEGLFDTQGSKIRMAKAEGSMLVAPEMPVDTFTPEEQANAESSQLPDNEMEDDYMGFMLDESLDETEQEYLMELWKQIQGSVKSLIRS